MSKPIDINKLTPEERRQLAELLGAKEKQQTENKLAYFTPTPKQKDFIALTGEKKQALLLAGNQLGKSEIGAYILAAHLTGQYPDDWKGRRFNKSITAWVGAVTSKMTRDVAQSKLCGPWNIPEQFGTGLIPKTSFVGKPAPSHGVQGSYDTVSIRHASGGISTLTFLSYEMGAEKWMAGTIDYIWLDEESPEDIYLQCLARTAKTAGSIVLTYTPENGMLRVLPRFWPEPDSSQRGFIQMGLKDATFLSEEARQEMLERYPPSQRALRLEGIPMIGSGKVYETDEADYVTPPHKVDPHTRRIFGIDFGHSSDPTCVVWGSYDRENDLLEIYDEWSGVNTTIQQNAHAIRSRGVDVVGAWPADGGMRERGSGAGSGRTLVDLYKREGIRMLPEPAKLKDGTARREGGIAMVENRLETGRLKIFSTCTGLLGEMRMYHRKDGAIADKQSDHFVDALRYLVVCLDHARMVRPPGSASGNRGGNRNGGGELPWFMSESDFQ